VCVDVREYPAGHEVTVAELERAVETSSQEVRAGDILLFCSDHYNRTAGTPAFLDGFSGVAAECVHWMANRGVKIFGVETISPDLVYLTDGYPTHRACAERALSHYENLNNLKEVVNRRFDFFGFPLRLEPAAGSPVRAVGIVDD
jgi:kynurenine formamidase